MVNAAHYWSTLTLNMMKEDFSGPSGPEITGPGRTSRAFAMVHAAFHDAYVSGVGSGRSYRFASAPEIRPSTVLGQVSGARSAYQILYYFYSRQRPTLDKEYASFIALLQAQTPPPTSRELAEGERIGEKIAHDLIASRLSDTEGRPPAFTELLPPRVHGAHDADPVSGNVIGGRPSLYGEYWGLTRPFLVSSGDVLNLRADPPPRLDSVQYRDSLLEVRDKGNVKRRNLNIPETAIGYFWAYDGTTRMGTPPRLFNQILHRLAAFDNLTEGQMSELLCRCNLAMADAAITAWDTKFAYYFWRPILGIRRDLSDPDPSWEPIGAPTNSTGGSVVQASALASTGLPPNFTPPFPAYTSGHATFGAACFETAKLFRHHVLGKTTDEADRIDLELISDELDGTAFDHNLGQKRPYLPMRYKSLDKMIVDNLESRIWLGVHWRFDGDRGEQAGRTLAQRAYKSM